MFAAFMLFAVSFSFVHLAYGSYTVTHLNTTVILNANTSAAVKEILTVHVSNQSVQQYTADRVALNLTLDEWEALVGPMLVQHIINPTSGVYNFRFLPGPLIKTADGGTAYLIMSYDVLNVTKMSQTSPRLFTYRFDPNVLNFEHGASGEVLPANTTFSIILPPGAVLSSVYPIPDAPESGITNNYANVSEVSWFYGEPLSKFELTFTITESLQQEVSKAFLGVYRYLGVFSYIIIALAILLFVIYAYVKAGK